MKISWLSENTPELASFRYRIAIPAFILGSKHRVSLGETGKVVVASKHFESPDRVERLRAAGKAVLFDCCDNHFGGPLREHYLRMCRAAHLITVPTETMQAALKAEGFDSVVIPDPIEMRWGEPLVRGPEKLFWYGHASNYQPLLDLAPRLEGYICRLVSNAPGTNPWSPIAMMDGFKWCDAVILPQVNDAKRSCKSTNRIVEGIWSGRFVCANSIPSWDQFAPYAWIGDIPEGLAWMKANPAEAKERITAGQAYIREKFSPVAIGKLWEAALEKCLDYGRSGVHRASSGGPHLADDTLEGGRHGPAGC